MGFNYSLKYETKRIIVIFNKENLFDTVQKINWNFGKISYDGTGLKQFKALTEKRTKRFFTINRLLK